MGKKKVRKSWKKRSKKTFFIKSWGCFGGVFGVWKVPKKNISRWLRPKKKSQNENSQRWIDSQLNSASFKTDFKLKGQKKLKILIKITLFTIKTI